MRFIVGASLFLPVPLNFSKKKRFLGWAGKRAPSSEDSLVEASHGVGVQPFF